MTGNVTECPLEPHLQIVERRGGVCGILTLLVACFKRRDGQFVEPAAVGTAQQYEILEYIHITKRQRSLMRGDTSLEKLHSRRLDSLSVFTGHLLGQGCFRSDRSNSQMMGRCARTAGENNGVFIRHPFDRHT